MTENVPDRERRRAADLRTGDRIVPGDLLGAGRVEEVAGVYPYTSVAGTAQVLVVVRDSEYQDYYIHYFRADESVALVSEGADVPAGVQGGPVVGRAAVPGGGAR